MDRLLFKQSNMKKLILISGCFLALLYISSCTYKFNEPEPPKVLNPNDTVSFATQIIPIFNNNNNCTTCHKTGAQKPDLTAANAYSQISTMGLIDHTDAAKSKIYDYIQPATSTHSHKKYTTDEAALVLLWLTQGALNN